MITRRGCHQDPILFPEFSVRKFSFPGAETCFSELGLLPLIQSVVGGWGLQEWIQGDKRGWKLSFSESLLSPKCCALCFTHIVSNPPTMSHSNLRLMPMHSLPPLPVVSVPVETSWDLFSYGNIPLALCSFIHSFSTYLLGTYYVANLYQILGVQPWAGWLFRTAGLPHSVSKGSPQSRWLYYYYLQQKKVPRLAPYKVAYDLRDSSQR